MQLKFRELQGFLWTKVVRVGNIMEERCNRSLLKSEPRLFFE